MKLVNKIEPVVPVTTYVVELTEEEFNLLGILAHNAKADKLKLDARGYEKDLNSQAIAKYTKIANDFVRAGYESGSGVIVWGDL